MKNSRIHTVTASQGLMTMTKLWRSILVILRQSWQIMMSTHRGVGGIRSKSTTAVLMDNITPPMLTSRGSYTAERRRCSPRSFDRRMSRNLETLWDFLSSRTRKETPFLVRLTMRRGGGNDTWFPQTKMTLQFREPQQRRSMW